MKIQPPDDRIATPRWVFVGGELHNVAEYAPPLPIHLRPAATCPECGQVVILKLGQERVFHYAHHAPLPGQGRCPLTNPESARHSNGKFNLYVQLRQTRQLALVDVCAGYFCFTKAAVTWRRGWDDVRVEYRTSTDTRPDVVLLKDDKVIGALEVFATHPVSDAKRARLRELGIPWIEVDADTADEWRADTPLAHLRIEPPLPPGFCGPCRAKLEAENGGQPVTRVWWKGTRYTARPPADEQAE